VAGLGLVVGDTVAGMKTALPLALALLALAGCATYAPGDKAAEARLKQLQPIPGRVSLYVCYEKATLPNGALPRIWVDDTNLGAIKANSFAHASLSPGRYGLRVYKDGPFGGRFSGTEFLDGSADQVAIYWVGMTGKGWGTLTIDKFNTDAEARACIASAEYAVKAPGR
jgi:hypothetical protein